MGYEIHWTEEQIDAAASEYSKVHGLRDALKTALKDKAKKVKWARTPADLPPRFHRVFSLNNLTVAEIKFNIHGKEFRAICVVLHDIETIVFEMLVDKETENQARKLALMRKRAEDIEAAIREEVSSEPP
ncbi:MAG: hypothetical protein SVW02_01645 [Candidatus Nanohaloarchaea archaeon]|nr:hypothetical protein [Candidatus Nanohaloarchaea archaeon]